MKEGDSIATHLTKIESMIRNLRDIKEVLSESAICSKVINSLPQKYNAFRTAWDSVAANDQTFANLTARLLKEESRMTATEDETTRLALQIEALQGKIYHRSFDNKKKKSIDEIKKSTNCNYCKKKGHWARECRIRISDAKKNRSGNSSKADSVYLCDLSNFYSASSDDDEQKWICDSGASMHMTNQLKWFTQLEDLHQPLSIKIANDKVIKATGKGTIKLKALVKGKWHDREMHDVLYVPELKRSLFSVGVMTDKKFTHHANQNQCEFRDQAGKVSCVGERKNNLWYTYVV